MNGLQCDLTDSGVDAATYTKQYNEPSLQQMSEAEVRLLYHRGSGLRPRGHLGAFGAVGVRLIPLIVSVVTQAMRNSCIPPPSPNTVIHPVIRFVRLLYEHVYSPNRAGRQTEGQIIYATA